MVELHAYACPPGVGAADLGAAMLAELGRLWPETRRLHQVDQHCHVGTDAAGFPVGGHATTPGVRTAVPGLTLAGDWVATPFPSALMERAAATGIGAANAILAAHGYRHRAGVVRAAAGHPRRPVGSVDAAADWALGRPSGPGQPGPAGPHPVRERYGCLAVPAWSSCRASR